MSAEITAEITADQLVNEMVARAQAAHQAWMAVEKSAGDDLGKIIEFRDEADELHHAYRAALHALEALRDTTYAARIAR